MTNRSRPRALTAGLATSVGSLPHVDPAAAAELVLAHHPSLPAIPELPNADPAEGMIARWTGFEGRSGPPERGTGRSGPPERGTGRSGPPERGTGRSGPPARGTGPESVTIDAQRHGGMLAFVAAAAAGPPAAVKAQVAGPLTLGVSLLEGGCDAGEAFSRGADLSKAAATATLDFLTKGLPHTDVVLFLDEPSLVLWAGAGSPPIEREHAVDLLSGVLAGIDAVTGVHVCGDGDRRMAIEAGPDIVGFEVRPSVLDDGVAVARYLDAGGWVAWGAIPTDRPVGERADHWWNALVSLWCDLTRGGCDPVTLRTQALITPACGLSEHSEAQAATILDLCVEIGERVREQAIATRLTVGA